MFATLFEKFFLLVRTVYLHIIYCYPRYKAVRALDIKGKDVVLFYLPYGEFITGGILSVFFLLEKSIALRPDKVVLPIVITRLQRYFRTSWFKSPFFIYNLLDLREKLKEASRIVIHVPECLCPDFFKKVEAYKLQPFTQKAVINILNQNVESMPSHAFFYQHKAICGKLTMTLAFAVNQSKCYPFLDLPPMTMSAWSFGDKERYTDFTTKENICIVSPDAHPLKSEIVRKLTEYGVECIEIRNMPFSVYRDLCTRAKWSVTFGEGYDGYAMGTLKDGGIGFAVDSPDFRPAYIDVCNLPLNIFHSYPEMCDQIIQRMIYFENNTQERNAVSHFFRENARKLNSPELVTHNLDMYYKAIGF